MNEQTFLGAGMKFPPQIDAGTGRFAVSSGVQSVRESVYLILMTNQGERWLESEFGSDMITYTFMDTSPTMLRMMSDHLRDKILEQEPRISDVDIDINPQERDGCIMIYINYTVASTHTEDSLVFPFYLNAMREETEL